MFGTNKWVVGFALASLLALAGTDGARAQYRNAFEKVGAVSSWGMMPGANGAISAGGALGYAPSFSRFAPGNFYPPVSYGYPPYANYYINPFAPPLANGIPVNTEPSSNPVFGPNPYEAVPNAAGYLGSPLGAEMAISGGNISRGPYVPLGGTSASPPSRAIATNSGWARNEVVKVFSRSSVLPSKGNIQVLSEGPTVVLRGVVGDEGERRLAESLARFTPGVYDVRNELQVGSASSAPSGQSP
jgi:hypothetical protein